MKIIIPIKDKFKYIDQFRNILSPNEPLFVFDRCEPPERFTGQYKIHTDERDTFLAGKVRDFGAEDCYDDIMFFDQDKVPDINPERVLYDINRDFFDCIIFFTERDNRQIAGNMFYRDDYIGWKKYFDTQNYLYTCGIWISAKMIEKLRRLNGGRIFHPAFDGRWGEEDRFLGDEIVALGGKIGYISTVRLAQTSIGNAQEHITDFSTNFGKRLQLRNTLSPKFMDPYLRITWGDKLITDIDETAKQLKEVGNKLIEYKACDPQDVDDPYFKESKRLFDMQFPSNKYN